MMAEITLGHFYYFYRNEVLLSMLNGEIISVGSELLLGQIANTDAKYVSEFLKELGMNVFYHTAVGDNKQRLKEVIEIALKRSDLIIFTGGLGPTDDDLTKETVAEALGKKLVKDPYHEKKLKEQFDKRLQTNNLKQANIIEGSVPLLNPNGTAPGIYLEENGKTIILFPGPPKELVPMLRNEAAKYLRKKQDHILLSKVMAFTGIGESDLELRIKDLLDHQSNPTIAPLAKENFVTLRIAASAETEEEARNLVEETDLKIREVVGDYLIYSSYEEMDMDSYVGKLLLQSGKTVSLAESITGGNVAAALIKTPGMSQCLIESVVCYTETSKINTLGVKKELIDEYTAVSAEVTKALAGNIRLKNQTDLGIAITGYAGPNDGENNGKIFVGISTATGLNIKEFRATGNREKVLGRAVFYALNMIRETLMQLS